MIVLWPVAVTVSYLSVLSFRRRLSFVPVEPRAWGESTSRLVKHGRYAPLTILFNQMVSHWKAYVLSYALMGALFWWMGRNPDAWDLDRPIWWARIAGTIVACLSMGFIVQRIEKGEAPNEFQYLLLPVSARQVGNIPDHRSPALRYSTDPVLVRCDPASIPGTPLWPPLVLPGTLGLDMRGRSYWKLGVGPLAEVTVRKGCSNSWCEFWSVVFRCRTFSRLPRVNCRRAREIPPLVPGGVQDWCLWLGRQWP